MEMALLTQSPLYSRSQPTLVVRPTTLGGGLAQSFLRTTRFARSRIIRCTVASSDFPNRKSRKMVSPKVKVAAFRGYVPRLPTESSTKKNKHHDSDEETGGTYNRLLSTDREELTSSGDLETAEVDLPQNASISSESGEVNVAEEAALDMFELELSGNALVEAVDEAAVKEDKFEVDFSGTELSSAAVWEQDPKDEAKAEEDISVVDLLGIATNSDTMREVVDEAEVEEDRVEVDLLGIALNDAAMDEVDLMGEAGAIWEGFDVHLSGNASSSGTYGNVVESSEETSKDQDKVVFSVDEGSIVGSPKHDIGPNEQDQSIVRSHEQEQDKSIVDQSIVGSHKQDGSIVGVPKKIQSIVGYSKPEQSIIGLHKQQQSIIHIPEEKQSIDEFRTKELEAKDGDYTSQKTDGDMLHAKSDVDLLQKHMEDFIEEALEMTTSKKIMAEVEMETAEDRFLHQLSEEESSWSEDEDDLDPQALQRMLQELAEKNYSLGNKIFVFPEKSELAGGWCKKDFVLQIESTMDEHLFEDFLVEEKQRELERLDERKRQTEEQRRMEEERAADEADRKQARAEVETKKKKLQNALGSATSSVDNLCAEIWMHGGYNNWIDGLSFAERLVHHDDKDGDWWYADGNARNYDNNGRQDFHAILPNNMSDKEYWLEEEQRIYTRVQQERREREEAIRLKAERRAKMKAEMKEKTMRMFLVSQKHIVYTEPLEIHAGTTVDVLYNPSNTVLKGKPEDAYIMDFVFSESEEGGIFDNRNGLDYHIPVFGSIAKEPPMHIVHIAVEMAPIAKVGGLGDVVTSLSRAVQDLGHNVEVILPKHDCLNLSNVKNLHIHQSFSWGGSEIKVWRGLVEDLCVYFLEPQNGMFGVGCVYGRNDDRRFGFFCHSALEFLLQSGSSPNIIHCHDWSSAPAAWLFKENYAQSSLANARVVFTIHNLEFGAHHIGKAMKYCDKATTVSNTYSREVSGHGAIAPHLGKFYGILNGIDQDIWDPYSDGFIPVHYTPETVIEGKSAAKKALQQKLGLQQNDVPIVGIITRLTAQKGIHLIKHAMKRTLERNGQVVLLGSAPDPRIQGDFANLANTLQGENHGRVKLCLTYDEPLSHLIYAGSDFILVPSIFEPCGLTQLVAMRYGAIPIVRKTGGLYDTVFDVDNDKDRARARGLEPNGFSFDGADNNGVDYALNRQALSHRD
ncbi:Soluble starch synthase 3, chloroplastic/amyloplastic [Dichanthelium oligosanthes]|uniref:starch synthase n=1 Tax=Dichanthelium oligosanthes TaxID=888268 RepID=A0A1E5UM14_9POAL|nr:Soluble starch synthase 3, chloroplastic/amyloplastic [Dichanthelium oligosanthes]